jgi:hypothetical protein
MRHLISPTRSWRKDTRETLRRPTEPKVKLFPVQKTRQTKLLIPLSPPIFFDCGAQIRVGRGPRARASSGLRDPSATCQPVASRLVISGAPAKPMTALGMRRPSGSSQSCRGLGLSISKLLFLGDCTGGLQHLRMYGRRATGTNGSGLPS